MLSLLTVFLSFFAAVVTALPAAHKTAIVWNPHVTYPTQGIAWAAGTALNVTWDTSGMPKELQSSRSTIVLGHYANNSENLDLNHPLAKDFFIKDGHVIATMPPATVPGNYFIVLFGDSGNVSPEFKVTRPVPARKPGLLGLGVIGVL